MKQHFEMMAAYNLWANERIYDAAAALDAEALGRDVGAFFKSMIGTLNHVLVADRIWMKRFTGEGDAPNRLDAVLHTALPALRIAREAEDRRILAWISGLDEEALSGRFTYVTVTDVRTVSQRMAPALSHFFNHQTHHRGQAHTILSLLDRDPPSLDLIQFQRTPAGRAFS
ncbi:DinB family protein [Nitratireductor sp. ZSWI3]|uniref:DinB family protein n=1 Tax=Nitratireductor sp. ZSWI3 TaxID=2966359 RepID=UPI0021501212|nr:DinB family protein [Nitratireductor sp. ZSWI3]MCR4267787.1 DinB family protein [Nitratireductor sp. ZSWI3]